ILSYRNVNQDPCQFSNPLHLAECMSSFNLFEDAGCQSFVTNNPPEQLLIESTRLLKGGKDEKITFHLFAHALPLCAGICGAHASWWLLRLRRAGLYL